MFFWKKEKFVKYAERIRKFLDKGDYDSAIARYNKLEGFYNLLDGEKKLKYREEYESLLNQLLIYMKIQKLDVVIEGDNLDLIKDNLNYLEDMSKSVGKISVNYEKFVQMKYKKFYNEYGHKLVLVELNEILEKIYKLRDEQNYDLALVLFPDLMKKYKELKEYVPEKSRKLLEGIHLLREDLKERLLEFRAYADVAETNVKTLKRSLRKRKVEEAKELHKKVFPKEKI